MNLAAKSLTRNKYPISNFLLFYLVVEVDEQHRGQRPYEEKPCPVVVVDGVEGVLAQVRDADARGADGEDGVVVHHEVLGAVHVERGPAGDLKGFSVRLFY